MRTEAVSSVETRGAQQQHRDRPLDLYTRRRPPPVTRAYSDGKFSTSTTFSRP
eukprot:SAG31_NODE_21054_length_559_cov_0.580435_1_plen_52_part_10